MECITKVGTCLLYTYQIEQQKTRIEQLEIENQQWQELTQKLNRENSLLLKMCIRDRDRDKQLGICGEMS